jgi:hypothetical protein
MEATMSLINWDATKEEIGLIVKIVKRAKKICPDINVVDTQMDLTATHKNGCPLNFKKMLKADDFNLMHDIHGIGRHLNRTTGKLMDCFLPRCSGN